MLETNDVDAESFYRAVLIVRGIAVSRPHNLIKYAELYFPLQIVNLDDPFGKIIYTDSFKKNFINFEFAEIIRKIKIFNMF